MINSTIRQFRFHTGSIKRNEDESGDGLFLCFDSILVRLKDVYGADEFYIVMEFRFHTGSIKSARVNA